jgi:hypothetical protein
MRDRDGGDLTADLRGGGGEVCTVVVVCFPNDQCRVINCLTELVIASNRTSLTHRQNNTYPTISYTSASYRQS